MNKLKSPEYKNLTKQGVINEITSYINEQLELSRRKCLSDESFSKASWPYIQAQEMGIQKALLKMLNYLPEK